MESQDERLKKKRKVNIDLTQFYQDQKMRAENGDSTLNAKR